MTVKKLVKSTHPLLKKESKIVNQYDDQLKSLLKDLEDTLYEDCLLYTSDAADE